MVIKLSWRRELPGVNWSDVQTLGLNVANIGLGVATAFCFAALGYGLAGDWREHRRRRAAGREMARAPREPWQEIGRHGIADGRSFHVPGLGWTMADGGELITPSPDQKNDAARKKKRPRK